MKKTNLKLIGTMVLSLIASQSFSQGNNWRINGNNNTNPTNNFLGTTTNDGVSFRTFGIQRLYIDNGVGINTGRVAFGDNLPAGFTPSARLHLHQTAGVVATRYTTNATGSTVNDGLAIGISPTGDAFFINNEFNQNFSWYNQGAGPGSLLGRMRLYDGGVGTTTGQLALSNDLPAGFVPQDRLHLYQTSDATMIRFSNDLAVNGFRVGANANGVGIIRHMDNADILMRTDIGRMRMYGANPPAGVPNGIVRIGANNGFGPVLQQPRFLVVGSEQDLTPNGDFMVAEFRNEFDRSSSTGIKVRGSRDNLGMVCSAHIDLSNFDQDENGGTEFIMARFGSDMETASGERGNLSIFTGNGSGAGQTGLTQAMYFSADQNVGIGDENVFNITPANLPTQRLDVDGNGRFRTLPTAPFDATVNPAIDKVVMVDNTGVLHWADASSFGDGTGTDDQNLTAAYLTGNDLTIEIENGAPVTVDLSDLNLVTANNGVSLTALNEIQLGVPCNIGGGINLPGINANSFTEDRVVPNRNYDLWFASGLNETGGVGFGGQPTGIPFCGVGNTVEISSNDANLNYGTAGSGLRFTHLTAASTTLTNGTNGVDNSKVLSVDQNGDVVLVDAASGIGGYCSNPGQPLIDEYLVELNDFNIFIDGQGTQSSNSVAIGLPCGTILPAKFNVLENDPNAVNGNTIAGGFQNNDLAVNPNTRIIGIKGIADRIQSSPKVANIGGDFYANNADINIGVRSRLNNQIGVESVAGEFTVNGNSLNTATGLFSTAEGANNNSGVVGQGSSNSTTGGNFGGQFIGSGGQFAYGVYGSAVSASTTNYAVFGTVSGTSGNNPPQPSGPNYAGYFNGDVYISGSYGPSDANMKTNVQDYDSSLYVISQLEPKTFEYTDANYQGMSLPTGHQYGLIAQEVEQVLPNIVSDNVHPAQYDTTGAMIHPEYQFKGVDYEALIPILLGGVKEQQEIIETQNEVINSQDSLINDLNARLSSLESCLSNILPELCQVNSTAIMQNDEQAQEQIVNQLEVILKDEQSIVLEQNVPNPFAEQTLINYYIPNNVQKAQIHFYNLEGQLINTVEISEFGNGQLKVFGSDLSSGTYTYTLVADGKVITTKKMVKTN